MKTHCQYCGGITVDDARGHCGACGGPREMRPGDDYNAPRYISARVTFGAENPVYLTTDACGPTFGVESVRGTAVPRAEFEGKVRFDWMSDSGL